MDAAYSGSTLIWCKHSDEYFTIEILTAGTLTLKFNTATTSSQNYITLDTEMSLNGGTWERVGDRTITVSAGDKIRLRGEEVTYQSDMVGRIKEPSGSTVSYKVYGNIMSLLDGDGFLYSQGFNGISNVFDALFFGSKGIVDASWLVLPEQTLSSRCYYQMFRKCSNLVSAPMYLPAVDLRVDVGAYQYAYMFSECSSLVNPPTILAQYGGIYSFEHMFSHCTSLTTSPDLQVRQSAQDCFDAMFDGCTALSLITCRMLNPDSTYNFKNWVRNVSPTGVFKKAHLANWTRGVNGIPENWTVQNVT